MPRQELKLYLRSKARREEGWVPESPHSCSNRPLIQSSLSHSRPAHGTVLRLTAFKTNLRSRRDNQSAHCPAGHSSDSELCPQSAPCCFLSRVQSYLPFLLGPEFVVVISGGTAGRGPAPSWWLQNDVSCCFEKEKGKEDSRSGQWVDFL